MRTTGITLTAISIRDIFPMEKLDIGTRADDPERRDITSESIPFNALGLLMGPLVGSENAII